MDIQFEVYNLIGQKVYQSAPIAFDAMEEAQLFDLHLPHDLSSGMYLVRPMEVNGDKTRPGHVVGSGGDSYKLVFMK